MSKTKVIFTAFVAVLALSALASAAASAATAGWMVNGTLLASGTKASLATTAKVDNEAILKSTTANIELLCNSENLIGSDPLIEGGGNMGSATFLEFSGCQALTPNCTIETPTIKTVPLLAEATLEGASAVNVKFKPQTKTVFATFLFLGTKCATAGSQAVTGTASVLAPTGQEENTLQLINATSVETSGELKVASSGASLTGSALLKLASGQTWSFL